ncbi:right-handed parallel beta-helix repeat-containing protein [Sphingobacterium sp. N143]|uniref:right-handed parallel beta-helix repeat-containing protein n=1 Tax=Sphingobacterium sp. N143 TaxID=2746727 RepID=UPI002577FF25|nr:right-handed parallel beta-helix repeat-containing protein [Sphingobacterium sp. N143]MDM1295659.1 right-handed parallel beta-helix repeat-containing protein [Sphingobacterium sp. N143]
MKKSLYILMALFLILGIQSCKKDKIESGQRLLIDQDYMEVGSRADTYQLNVLSNEIISVSADMDWIKLDSTIYPKGKNKIKFSVSKNSDDERSATLLLKVNDNLSQEILILQESGKVPVFYVAPAGKGDGSSWSTVANLDLALEKASTGSTIYLTEGTYVPLKTIRNGDVNEESDKTIEISKNIRLIGGYAANAKPGDQPDPAQYKTIFDGKLSSGKSAFHTVTVTATLDPENKVSLENITIIGGNATDRSTSTTINNIKFSRGQGGGMLIATARVALKNVDVVENKATADKGTAGFAAGVYAFSGAQITMENCRVSNNTNSNNNGGGLWIADGSLTAYDSQFNHNSAKGTAGGVHAYPNSDITLYNCEVIGNANTSYGAGVYLRERSKGIFVNCLFANNSSSSPNGGGGLMLYDNCKADVISSTITGNHVVGPGGGIYRRSNVNNLTLINSIISGNTQAGSSTDVDAYSDNTTILPLIQHSVASKSVYGADGTIIPKISFEPATMLNQAYLPVGNDNPAMSYGLASTEFLELAKKYNPVLDNRIQNDINNNPRSSNWMGAKEEIR